LRGQNARDAERDREEDREQVGIGGMIRDKKAEEEEMLNGDTQTAMVTAGAPKDLQTEANIDLNKQIMGAQGASG
jgi:hypothetical protein